MGSVTQETFIKLTIRTISLFHKHFKEPRDIACLNSVPQSLFLVPRKVPSLDVQAYDGAGILVWSLSECH